MRELAGLTDFRGLPEANVPESRADMVYRALHDAIADGAFAPGLRLREIPLARHFGLSTTPVREALRRLARDGLVEISPNRGATVAAFDVREIVNLYAVREVLERHAVRLAATAATRDFHPIEELLVAAEVVLAVPDQIAFNRLDIAFHRLVNGLGDNPPLADLAEQVHRRIQRVRVRCAVQLPGRPALSHAQHRALLAAIQERDADRAEALIGEHIHSVRDAVVQVLGGTRGQAPDAGSPGPGLPPQ